MGQQMRDEIAGVIHQVNQGFAIFDADVHVEAKNQVGAGYKLHVFDNVFVAFSWSERLHTPVGERMGGGGGYAQIILAGQTDDVMAEIFQLFAGIFNIRANGGADFDDGLMHLRLDALLQDQLALLDDFGVDVRAKIPGFGVDGLIFLFDSKRECRLHRGIRTA